MDDATEETFELADGLVDSQEPLTAGYGNENDGEAYVVGEKDRNKDGTSFAMSVFNLMNEILGSGILGLANICQSVFSLLLLFMKNCTFMLIQVLLRITGFFTGHSINMVLFTSKNSGETSYERLVVLSFGRPTKILTSFVIARNRRGAVVSCVLIIKKEMPGPMRRLANSTSIIKIVFPSQMKQYPERQLVTSVPSSSDERLCVICLERPAFASFLCCCANGPCLCLDCEAEAESCPFCGWHC